jgi:hypothetical protein
MQGLQGIQGSQSPSRRLRQAGQVVVYFCTIKASKVYAGVAGNTREAEAAAAAEARAAVGIRFGGRSSSIYLLY